MRLLEERGDFLELGCTGFFQDLEYGGFHGGQENTGLFHETQASIPVPVDPGTDSIPRDMNGITPIQKVKGCLEDTNVGLHPGQDHLFPAQGIQLLGERLLRAAGKKDLFNRFDSVKTGCNRIDGGPQPFCVLLGKDDGD